MSRRALTLTAVAGLALASAVAPASLVAQGATGSVPAAATPDWLQRWSPLRPLGDAPREFPAAGATPPAILTLPPPRIGLFWSAGNPAGLPADVRDAWGRFTASVGRTSGDYRRPLDPGSVEVAGLGSSGWRTLGDAGAVIGRVSVDRVTMADGVHMNRVDPYTATPFAIVDTAGADVGRTEAVLEGAGGMRLGPIALGLALAFAPAETRTVAAPVPKVNISARPAVTAGVAWVLGPALTIGAHGRWRRTTQRLQHLAVAAGSRIYELAGFHDPIPLDLATYYSRRLETEATGAGVSAAGTVAGTDWVLHGEVGTVDEEVWDGSADDVSRDGWSATSQEAGLAIQRPVRSGDWTILATGRVLWSALDGTAYLAERDTTAWHAEAGSLRLTADVRVNHPSGWSGAVVLGTTRATRYRRDDLARVYVDLSSWSPTAAVEVGRELGSGFAASAGAAVAQYAPSGALPDPASLGEIYRAWIAPEHMMYGTPAFSYAGATTLRWTHPSGSTLWIRGNCGAVRRRSGAIALQLSPEGERTGCAVALGVGLPGSGN